MRRIIDSLKNLFAPATAASRPELSAEELRDIFRRRYSHFRSLLTANNNALQAMAELERIYYSGNSYRMATIRSKLTAILVNVYKMVDNLLAMSDGRYTELRDIYERLSVELETIITRQQTPVAGPYILDMADISRAKREQVGEKMANLGEIARLPGMLVPQGFAITDSATRYFLPDSAIEEINRRLQLLEPEDYQSLYGVCAELRQLILSRPLPADLEELILLHYSKLETGSHHDCPVAVRSSALGEDSAGVSFAGLYNSVLDVHRDQLAAAYKEVIAGKYGPKAVAYRQKRGYRHEDIEMCVGCLLMVDALISGVTYSHDPEEKDSDIIRINATAGMASGVVDGTVSTDLYLVGRDRPHPLLFNQLRQQKEGSQEQVMPLLTYNQIKRLAEMAISLEAHFGCPQDVEWSIDHQGRCYILQSRPIQTGLYYENSPASADDQLSESGEEPLLFGGICASAGVVCGQVHQVRDSQDMHSFPHGAVLVVEHPLPEWAPLLNRAAAVLAESGTEAGHLATVSREFGLPALFSLPGVCRQLTSGETITVNASARAVYAGCREDLLRKKPVKRDIMAGSPVQRILTEALQLITPLNLNDPASPQFKSSWCETLHDITRFCHEKSVAEMFHFGRRHHFDKGSAKRLVGDVPLEWWVINLADGFRDGVDDEAKSIRIGDIVSVPMLAIWQGIAAYPWQGPPPVSVRGFGSIIFQSTMRPELDPAVPSGLTTKNYFLISEHFCNLSVRLGYHYAMIEAYISDLLTESYVTFRFKGGAADLRRKAVRARLLADILESYGFRIELQSDSLLARLKKHPTAYLQDRLRILGYLTLHARQLDMVMTEPQAVERYRQKFLQEIEEMLARYRLPAEGGPDHG